MVDRFAAVDGVAQIGRTERLHIPRPDAQAFRILVDALFDVLNDVTDLHDSAVLDVLHNSTQRGFKKGRSADG